jgi:hypothetical protein
MQKLMNKIMERFLRDTPCANGCDSFFMEITSEIGAKLFASPLMRDRNYDRFVQYAIIAPKVGRKFEVKFNGHTMWGFLVEMVLTEGNPLEYHETRKIRMELADIAVRHGWKDNMRDLHGGNVGRRKGTNEPLVIDFSRFVDPDGFCYHSLAGNIEANLAGRWFRIQLCENGTKWVRE